MLRLDSGHSDAAWQAMDVNAGLKLRGPGTFLFLPVDGVAADALAVMDATHTDRAVLVGLSAGALWGALLAAGHPEWQVVMIGPVVKIDPESLNNPEAFKKFEQAQSQLSSALSRLLVVVERYPELKANQNFQNLQAQLEGTENRISVERMKYNEAVQDYNTYIRSFPRNFIAGWFDFDRKAPFAADPAAQRAALKRIAGSMADDPEFDAVMEEVQRSRKAARFRENLRQRVMTAQLALMMRQPGVWETETAALVKALESRYDPKSPQTRQALKLARQMADTSIAVKLPTVTNSLQAIESLREASAKDAASGVPDATGTTVEPASPSQPAESAEPATSAPPEQPSADPASSGQPAAEPGPEGRSGSGKAPSAAPQAPVPATPAQPAPTTPQG